MPTLADSSPLILFAAIGRLNLLHQLFGRVIVTPAVWREVVETGSGRIGAADVEAATWIDTVTPVRAPAAHELPSHLDAGEAELLALALESEHPLTLLDDRDARTVASDRGLAVVGSVGVVLLGKRRGFLKAAQPAVDELRTAGLYLDEALYRAILREAGEMPQESA